MLNLLPLVMDRELKDIVFYYKCLFGSTDINVLEHTLFTSHGHTRQSNPFLLFAESVLLRLPILIALLSYGILFVHLSPLVASFSSKQPFKQFVHKAMFTTPVNTYEVERSCTWTLVMTCPCHRSK